MFDFEENKWTEALVQKMLGTIMTNSPEIIENPSETQTRAETALSL